MSDRETRGCAGSRQADEVLGRNIRDEQGRADEKPAYVAACEKVLLGGSFPPGKVHADAEHQREIKTDNDDVRSCQSPMTRLDQRSVEHPLLLLGPKAEQPYFRSGKIVLAKSITGALKPQWGFPAASVSRQ